MESLSKPTQALLNAHRNIFEANDASLISEELRAIKTTRRLSSSRRARRVTMASISTGSSTHGVGIITTRSSIGYNSVRQTTETNPLLSLLNKTSCLDASK